MASPATSGCSLESGEWNDEDQSFYFDVHPTPYEHFDPDQSFEGYQHLFTKPRPDQTISGGPSSVEPLGSLRKTDLNEAKSHQQQQLRQPPQRSCFNCGESDHAVAQCPHPKDRDRIRQGRLALEESKAQRGDDNNDGFGEVNGHARIHEQVASAEQRLRWLDEFVPGKPSQLLIEALSSEASGNVGCTDNEHSSAIHLPYLQRMLIWGYPPGWISSKDPIGQIRQRIQRDSQWDSAEVLRGFDVAALDKDHSQPTPIENRGIDFQDEQHSGEDGDVKRWVDYQTDLFDSYRLQSFDTVFRAPLPKMPEQANHAHDWQRSRSLYDAEERWPDRRQKRSREKHEDDERAALWSRLLSEASASPPPRHDEPERASRHAPVRIARPQRPAPPPPTDPMRRPSPPSPPPPPPPQSPPLALSPPPPPLS